MLYPLGGQYLGGGEQTGTTLAAFAPAADPARCSFLVHIVGADFKQELLSALAACVDVTNVVGTRIYPLVVPQTDERLAAMSYEFTSTYRPKHLRGSTGWVYTRVRFKVSSPNHADIESVRDALRDRFDGLIGYLGALRVAFVWMEPEADVYAGPLEGSDAGMHRKHIDFRFKTAEILPSHT